MIKYDDGVSLEKFRNLGVWYKDNSAFHRKNSGKKAKHQLGCRVERFTSSDDSRMTIFPDAVNTYEILFLNSTSKKSPGTVEDAKQYGFSPLWLSTKTSRANFMTSPHKFDIKMCVKPPLWTSGMHTRFHALLKKSDLKRHMLSCRTDFQTGIGSIGGREKMCFIHMKFKRRSISIVDAFRGLVSIIAILTPDLEAQLDDYMAVQTI